MGVSEAHKAFGIIFWPRNFKHFRIGALDSFAVIGRCIQTQYLKILLVTWHDLKNVHAVNIVKEFCDGLAR